MKTVKLILPLCLIFFLHFQGFTQNTLVVIDDRLELVDDNVRTKIKTHLANRNLELVETVDYTKKCSYWYIVLLNTGVKDRMQLRNCNDRILYGKDIESMVNTLGPIERSIILASNINDLVEKANSDQKGAVTTTEPDTMAETPEYCSTFSGV